MKKWGVVLVILVVALAYWVFSSGTKTTPSVDSPPTTDAGNSAVANALARQNTNTMALIQSNFVRLQPALAASGYATNAATIVPSGPPAPLQFTNFEPAIVLQNMSRAIRQFGAMLGGNPVGTNLEITRQLNGHNPKHIDFINPEAGMRINENGELVDPWGTPYFFHQISSTVMEIHSAGPDKIMWNSDDLVAK